MLDEYVNNIKQAKTDREIKAILKSFYAESVADPNFRLLLGMDIAKDEDNEI